MGRPCEHLISDFQPEGKEVECIVRGRIWGTSIGIVIPKRTVDRLMIKPGDELRLMVRKLRNVTSMPIEG